MDPFEKVMSTVDRKFCVQQTIEGIYVVGSRRAVCKHCGADLRYDEYSSYALNGPHYERRCPYCARHVEYLVQVNSLEKWKRIVLEAFEYKCAVCGTEVDVQAHHSYPKQQISFWQYSPHNGICLCRICHKRMHSSKGRIVDDDFDDLK